MNLMGGTKKMGLMTSVAEAAEVELTKRMGSMNCKLGVVVELTRLRSKKMGSMNCKVLLN